MFHFANRLSVRYYCSGIRSLIEIQPEIELAIKANKPVVALESTSITHSMPYPQNYETSLKVESIVREEKAIPATIAILNGKIKVGLSKDDLLNLAKKSTGLPTVFTTRRDLAYVLSKKLNGGTTVSGTLVIANLVGINILATGGIGGVHREGQDTLDVSADLTELGRSPITVVSSGVKSIADIPRTLEYLETQGVLVSSYQSPQNEFPAFYTRNSGCKAPFNLNNAKEAALLISTAKLLKLNSGILIAVPIPEKDAMDDKMINEAVEQALSHYQLMKAEGADISGTEATPFLLETISKITEGKSIETNIALLKNNARIASQIAAELHTNGSAHVSGEGAAVYF